jgi:hypothetical protein
MIGEHGGQVNSRPIKVKAKRAMDIRDIAKITHTDVVGLNFIRNSLPVRFRRHFRCGLRSHIMEVLDPQALRNEVKGVVKNGIRHFPVAKPLAMLRIFRTKFTSRQQIVAEIDKLRIAETFLAPTHLAMSNEFIVTYRLADMHDLLLCGWQEYVDGIALDPWGDWDMDTLTAAVRHRYYKEHELFVRQKANLHRVLRQQACSFIEALKHMVYQRRMIPDLAGARNILVTAHGAVKLVDINNISPVYYSADIHLDDKGYPVCDKSIEALWLLERKLLGRSEHEQEDIYTRFLDSRRMRAVADIDAHFHHVFSNGTRWGKATD